MCIMYAMFLLLLITLYHAHFVASLDPGLLVWERASNEELMNRYFPAELCLMAKVAEEANFSSTDRAQYSLLVNASCDSLTIHHLHDHLAMHHPRSCTILGTDYFCNKKGMPQIGNKGKKCGAPFAHRLPFYMSHWKNLPPPAEGPGVPYGVSLYNTILSRGFSTIAMLGDSIIGPIHFAWNLGDMLRNHTEFDKHRLLLLDMDYYPCGLQKVGAAARNSKSCKYI